MLSDAVVSDASELLRGDCADMFWRRASFSDITAGFTELFRVRRQVQPDDRAELTSDQTARCWNALYEEFSCTMTAEQANKPTRAKRSCFNAYMQKRFGNKRFVMAIWQSGTAWLPAAQDVQPDAQVKALLLWCKRFRDAEQRHLQSAREPGCVPQAERFRI